MKISELINELERARDEWGDLHISHEVYATFLIEEIGDFEGISILGDEEKYVLLRGGI